MEILLSFVSVIMIFSVFLSLVKHDFWIFRVLEYPRLQKLVLIILITSCWIDYLPFQKLYHQLIVGGLLISILYLAYKIWPYSIFAKKEMMRFSTGDPKNHLKIFSANVLQDNKQYDKILQQIKSADPDLIFLLETDDEWARATDTLRQSYPFTLLAPQENTYGLLFYSRLQLENANIRFLVEDDIPSIEAIIILPSGQKVQLWGVHPPPPVPGESLYSTAKDKELMIIALKAKDCPLPALVIGDLNDVAWSHTTELFRKVSKMLDPRRGRGFYNTFSAHNWFIRFPLDYIFCSKEFGLISMKRMPKNGSDHFAMLIQLAFNNERNVNKDPPEADKEDLEEAGEMSAQPVKE